MNTKIVNIIGPNEPKFSIQRSVSSVVSVILLIILSSSLFRSIKTIKEGDLVIEKTRIKVQKAEEENKKLATQLETIKSDEYIEKQFRDKLGLAKEGEILLVLPDNETLAKLAPTLPNEEEISLKPIWKKWMDLFI